MENIERVLQCFDKLRCCDDCDIVELVDSLNYMYDWSPSSLRPYVVTGIYNLLIEVEEL